MGLLLMQPCVVQRQADPVREAQRAVLAAKIMPALWIEDPERERAEDRAPGLQGNGEDR